VLDEYVRNRQKVARLSQNSILCCHCRCQRHSTSLCGSLVWSRGYLCSHERLALCVLRFL